MHCDFAGYRGIEHGLAMMEKQMKQHGLAEGWLQEWRTTEINKHCLQLMKDSWRPPHHCFPGLNCLQTEEAAQAIASFRPSKDEASKENKLLAYERMKQWMDDNPKSFSPRRLGRKCQNHPGNFCPVSFDAKSPDAPWANNMARRPICVNSSSPMCLPWCDFGGKQGEAHPSMESWYLYTHDIQGGDYDLAFIENSSNMPIPAWKGSLNRNMSPKYITVGSEDLGKPAPRFRLAGVGVNEEELFWAGPSGDDMTADFLRFFGAACRLKQTSTPALTALRRKSVSFDTWRTFVKLASPRWTSKIC